MAGRTSHINIIQALAAAAMFAACSPLPGGSLDPLYLRFGARPAPATPTPSTATPSAVTPKPPVAPTGPMADVSGTWIGRYRDSRGEGEITWSLVRDGMRVSGSWRLRTGEGGSLTGIVQPAGRRLTLRMENASRNCPGTFEGWAEVGDTTLVGAYHGTDCEGAVSDGWFDLRPKNESAR